MGKIHEVMRILGRMKENKKERQSKLRIGDLTEKMYHYNDQIVVPWPNLFADSEIKRTFGDTDKIDFENNEHIAELLFILRHQETDLIEGLSREERKKEVSKIEKSISLSKKEGWQRALYEMFIALKKNSIRRQKEIFQQSLEILR